MSQKLIDCYKSKIKDYKKVQKNIASMRANLYEMNYPESKLNLHDPDGLIRLNVYRIEKDLEHIKKEVEEFLKFQEQHKESLEDWFTDFAQLLDLQNQSNAPMCYC